MSYICSFRTKFQYNTCFGSTELILFSSAVDTRFQYNTCFGSTHIRIAKSLFSFGISIQHLFRFDLVCLIYFGSFDMISIQHLFRFDIIQETLTAYLIIYFNTTLVSVRLIEKNKNYFYLLKFQYNTCFGSTLFV